MSVDFRIIAPSESEALLADPGFYQPQVALCTLGELLAWLAARGERVSRQDKLIFHFGDGRRGSFWIYLSTREQRAAEGINPPDILGLQKEELERRRAR